MTDLHDPLHVGPEDGAAARPGLRVVRGDPLIEAVAALPAECREQAASVLRALAAVGPNARALLTDVAEGLVVGRAYGDWTTPKDWRREGRQEARDGVLYTAQAIRMGKIQGGDPATMAANWQALQHFAEAHGALQDPIAAE